MSTNVINAAISTKYFGRLIYVNLLEILEDVDLG